MYNQWRYFQISATGQGFGMSLATLLWR